VVALLPTFSSIPPLFRRLSIGGCDEDEGDLLTDAALMEIVTAMGTSGRAQLRELQLINAPHVTNGCIARIIEECTVGINVANSKMINGHINLAFTGSRV